MLPTSLTLHNFLAYRDPAPLRFDGIHLACLTGANGAGKSSLLDAITWALWGEARARTHNDLIHTGQADMSVQLDFEQDGIAYRVMRKRTRKGSGTTQLNLYSLVEGGKLNSLTEGSVSLTQASIDRKLRMNYSTFVNSAFLQQGRADAFTTMQPRERKDLLSNILGLARWNGYEEAAKARHTDYEIEIRADDAEIKRIDADLAQLPALKAERDRAQAEYDRAKAALDIADALLAEVASAPRDLAEVQKRAAAAERRLFNASNDLRQAEADIADSTRKIAEVEGILAEAGAITEGYEVFQRARKADEALGKKLSELSSFDKQRNTLETAIASASAELKQGIGQASARLADFQRRIDAADREAYAQVRADLAKLGDLDAASHSFDNAMKVKSEARGELRATNASMRTEADEDKNRISQLSKGKGVLCPTCGQPLDDEQRLKLINALNEETEAKRERYRQNENDAKALDSAIDDLNAQKTALVKQQNQRRQLEKRESQLSAALEDANAAQIEAQAEEGRRIDLQRALDSDDYAAEARAQLAALDAQRAALAYDESQHSAARADLNQFRAYEERYSSLDRARAILPEYERSRDSAAARAETLRTTIHDDEAEMTEVKAQVEALTVRVEQRNQRELEANTLRTTATSTYQRLSTLETQIYYMDGQQENRERISLRLASNRDERTLYEELRLAFGKKGVPAWIIEAAIPELETSANRLLSKMSDGRMTLRLVTQREKLSGEGAIETLDIQIADELGTRDYSLFSGGESFRINFALRIALSQLLARRSGAQLRTLFIDEGFGTQDEDGRNKLVEAITAIQNDFDMILIVTHIEELRDSFPVHIAVEKRPDGSQVSVR